MGPSSRTTLPTRTEAANAAAGAGVLHCGRELARADAPPRMGGRRPGAHPPVLRGRARPAARRHVVRGGRRARQAADLLSHVLRTRRRQRAGLLPVRRSGRSRRAAQPSAWFARSPRPAGRRRAAGGDGSPADGCRHRSPRRRPRLLPLALRRGPGRPDRRAHRRRASRGHDQRAAAQRRARRTGCVGWPGTTSRTTICAPSTHDLRPTRSHSSPPDRCRAETSSPVCSTRPTNGSATSRRARSPTTSRRWRGPIRTRSVPASSAWTVTWPRPATSPRRSPSRACRSRSSSPWCASRSAARPPATCSG